VHTCACICVYIGLRFIQVNPKPCTVRGSGLTLHPNPIHIYMHMYVHGAACQFGGDRGGARRALRQAVQRATALSTLTRGYCHARVRSRTHSTGTGLIPPEVDTGFIPSGYPFSLL